MQQMRVAGLAAIALLAIACYGAKEDTASGGSPVTQATTSLAVNESPDMAIVSAATLKWDTITPPGFKSGMKIAALSGDPAGKGGYTIRLSFPDGYTFPAHYHPNAEHLTVLSGTFQLGMGSKEDASALKTYGPGDFLYIPGTMPHFGGVKGATVIQLHGVGPFEIKLSE